jgi:transposase
MTWSNRAMNAAASGPLPNDVAALRAMLVTAWAERDAERAEKARLAAECDQLAGQNDRLRHLIRQLQRLQFGRRSEKLDPDQLNLALEDVEQAIAETEAEQEKADPALRRARTGTRRAGRASLPEHLPRVEIVIAPENTACRCCGGAMQVIGEDRSSRLDVIPAQYRVLVTRRPKYACRKCQQGVVQAAAPARLIAGGSSRRCWWRSMPTIALCTAKRRSWRGRASRSTARPWPSGSGMRRPRSRRCGG